jgi:hypothetical protein
MFGAFEQIFAVNRTPWARAAKKGERENGFVVIHTAAAKLGWAAVRRGDDGTVRIAFAPSIAAALIGVFIARTACGRARDCQDWGPSSGGVLRCMIV